MANICSASNIPLRGWKKIWCDIHTPERKVLAYLLPNPDGHFTRIVSGTCLSPKIYLYPFNAFNDQCFLYLQHFLFHNHPSVSLCSDHLYLLSQQYRANFLSAAHLITAVTEREGLSELYSTSVWSLITICCSWGVRACMSVCRRRSYPSFVIAFIYACSPESLCGHVFRKQYNWWQLGKIRKWFQMLNLTSSLNLMTSSRILKKVNGLASTI